MEKALELRMARPYCEMMYYVYMIRSKVDPAVTYTGFTADLRKRMEAHNAGRNVSTASKKPWILMGYVAFDDKLKALEFEKYLKTSSGKAFANKRLWQK
ncbi:GIY-YIG nuclease family protein [Verrucomicrobiaceae bacterium R5-34]|nr:GIY-YIG nuclease family protein [Verrucomicrobiaceae bacterium R5-34]